MKLNIHAWILCGIALIVFLGLAFLIPFSHTAVFYIAVGCGALMFALLALAFPQAFRKDADVFSKILGWPLFRVAYTAMIIQIVVSFALMILADLCPLWAACLAELLIFAATAACMNVKLAARDAVTQTVNQLEDTTKAWKALRARADGIAKETGNPELRKLAEDMRYADPTPTELDGQIAEMLEKLSGYADAANIQKAKNLLNQRKALAKESK